MDVDDDTRGGRQGLLLAGKAPVLCIVGQVLSIVVTVDITGIVFGTVCSIVSAYCTQYTIMNNKQYTVHM